jgi:lipoprotein-anchoring transpeptidase ErfK/SrfK
VSAQAIAWANGLNNVNRVYVGQRLVIPNRSGAPVPSALPPGSSTPPSSSVGKEIVVVLHEQRVYAYENGTLVRSTLVSTGVARYPTRVGQFRIYTKYLSTLMTGPGYYLPNVPYTMYYSGGYALHGTYWHSNFGRPMSHGCVNLPTTEARWLYEWAPVGTLVTVRS